VNEKIRHGGCLCGAVRYRAAGEPLRTSICHCTQCRRQTGSAVPSFAVFPRGAVTIEKGEPAGYRASPRALRQFCRDCGSPLFWNEDGGAALDIFLGSFDEPAALPAPVRQIWAAHRVPWVTAIGTIPAHPADA